MLHSTLFVVVLATTSTFALPTFNSFGVPDNVLANETQLYPPYDYVLPTDYIPESQSVFCLSYVRKQSFFYGCMSVSKKSLYPYHETSLDSQIV